MKYILILFISMSVSFSSQAQDAISNLFGQYMDHEDFTSVYISPKLFQMVSKMESDELDPEVKEIISELDGLRILTSNKNSMKLYSDVSKTLVKNSFETLMTVKDSGEDVKFLIKQSGDKISELLLLVGGANEFVMMDFTGDIDLAKISKLSKNMDVKGIEYLDKIDKKN